MAEYIEREAAINEQKRFRGYLDNDMLTRLEIATKRIPVADVVSVVRCKDCQHIHIGRDDYYCRYWERWGLTPDGFCSVGAKMDGEV